MTNLRQALEDARRALLDLSTRNRLLSLPKPGRSRGVVILDDEDADFVAAALAAGRAFGRLRDLMTDARTAREETGVPTLYLALGTLSWRDPATPETERRAPLALLPVTLEREGVSQTFRLRASANEVAENLS